ncbi:hypothetical protein A9X04_03060 [Mycobacterium sp. E3247]|nr:hypothetical protein A9X04_03060 [Mycobacterium sp. E3247]
MKRWAFLEREMRDLKEANEILKAASIFFAREDRGAMSAAPHHAGQAFIARRPRLGRLQPAQHARPRLTEWIALLTMRIETLR